MSRGQRAGTGYPDGRVRVARGAVQRDPRPPGGVVPESSGTESCEVGELSVEVWLVGVARFCSHLRQAGSGTEEPQGPVEADDSCRLLRAQSNLLSEPLPELGPTDPVLPREGADGEVSSRSHDATPGVTRDGSGRCVASE